MVLLLIRWDPAMDSWDGWGVTSQGTQIFRRLLCCSAGTDVSLFHPLGQKLLSLGGTWGKMPVGETASTGFLVSFQLQHLHFSPPPAWLLLGLSHCPISNDGEKSSSSINVFSATAARYSLRYPATEKCWFYSHSRRSCVGSG